MTVETISGTPANNKHDFVVTTGTLETGAINTIVGVGEIGLIFDAAVDLRSINIDVVVQRLVDTFREQVLKAL